MKLGHRWRMMGLLAWLAMAALAMQAVAADAKKTTPTITDISVSAPGKPAVGTELTFILKGTPGGRASMRVAGIRRSIALREGETGTYQGKYTVTRRDRLVASGKIRATLVVGGHAARSTRQFGTVLQAAAPALPPAAAPKAPAASLGIQRLAVGQLDRIEPGADIRLTLTGTPGARASFTIDGIVGDVPMLETKVGQYEGSYTIRRTDQIPVNVNIVAALEANGNLVRSRLTQALVNDTRSPIVTPLSPKDGETVAGTAVLISASLDDAGGAGVDQGSIRLRIGGNDVTKSASITRQVLTYRTDLKPGTYPVEIVARDLANNTVRYGWSFHVGQPPAAAANAAGLAAGGLPLQILSHANNAQIPTGPTDVRGRTAPDAIVNIQVQSKAAIVGNFGVTQPVLSQTLHADANGNFGFTLQPHAGMPAGQYDMTIRARKGQLSNETRLTLQQR